MTRTRSTRSCFLAMLMVVLIGSGGAHGQGDPAAPATVSPETIPAIASFGVQFGFPAYRTVSATAGVQARFAGLVVRVGGGPGGVSVGLQGRAYPPLPIPVPTYVGAGFDFYAGRLAPHLVVGLHVPVAERWRLDIEAGVAWTPLLDDVRLTPYLGVGASYALAVGWEPSAPGSVAAAESGPSVACVPGAPDPGALGDAVAATIGRFVADALGTYGSVYRDLRYRTSVRTISIEGTRATMGVAYEGAVVEILTGREITATGEAEVDFRWDGCRWVRTALRY